MTTEYYIADADHKHSGMHLLGGKHRAYRIQGVEVAFRSSTDTRWLGSGYSAEDVSDHCRRVDSESEAITGKPAPGEVEECEPVFYAAWKEGEACYPDAPFGKMTRARIYRIIGQEMFSRADNEPDWDRASPSGKGRIAFFKETYTPCTEAAALESIGIKADAVGGEWRWSQWGSVLRGHNADGKSFAVTNGVWKASCTHVSHCELNKKQNELPQHDALELIRANGWELPPGFVEAEKWPKWYKGPCYIRCCESDGSVMACGIRGSRWFTDGYKADDVLRLDGVKECAREEALRLAGVDHPVYGGVEEQYWIDGDSESWAIHRRDKSGRCSYIDSEEAHEWEETDDEPEGRHKDFYIRITKLLADSIIAGGEDRVAEEWPQYWLWGNDNGRWEIIREQEGGQREYVSTAHGDGKWWKSAVNPRGPSHRFDRIAEAQAMEIISEDRVAPEEATVDEKPKFEVGQYVVDSDGEILVVAEACDPATCTNEMWRYRCKGSKQIGPWRDEADITPWAPVADDKVWVDGLCRGEATMEIYCDVLAAVGRSKNGAVNWVHNWPHEAIRPASFAPEPIEKEPEKEQADQVADLTRTDVDRITGLIDGPLAVWPGYKDRKDHADMTDIDREREVTGREWYSVGEESTGYFQLRVHSSDGTLAIKRGKHSCGSGGARPDKVWYTPGVHSSIAQWIRAVGTKARIVPISETEAIAFMSEHDIPWPSIMGEKCRYLTENPWYYREHGGGGWKILGRERPQKDTYSEAAFHGDRWVFTSEPLAREHCDMDQIAKPSVPPIETPEPSPQEELWPVDTKVRITDRAMGGIAKYIGQVGCVQRHVYDGYVATGYIVVMGNGSDYVCIQSELTRIPEPMTPAFEGPVVGLPKKLTETGDDEMATYEIGDDVRIVGWGGGWDGDGTVEGTYTNSSGNPMVSVKVKPGFPHAGKAGGFRLQYLVKIELTGTTPTNTYEKEETMKKTKIAYMIDTDGNRIELTRRYRAGRAAGRASLAALLFMGVKVPWYMLRASGRRVKKTAGRVGDAVATVGTIAGVAWAASAIVKSEQFDTAWNAGADIVNFLMEISGKFA